jgi:hypothetical protein
MSSSSRQANRGFAISRTTGLAIIILAYAAAVAVVGINGDFPLNDDWSYAATVRSLVFGHDWHPSGWTSATMLTQSLWAAPFCEIGHCSYVALRISSLVAASITLIVSIFLFLRATDSLTYLFIATAIVVFNPLSFPLQFTFMTEPVFAMLLIGAVLSFIKFIDEDKYWYLTLGCVLAVAATLCRQLGLSIPLGFLLAYGCYRKQTNWLRKMLTAMFPLIICAGALVIFDIWMRHTGRTPALYNSKTDLIAGAIKKPLYLLQRVTWNTTVFMLYLGLITAPLTIGRNIPPLASLPARLKLLSFGLTALITAVFMGVMVLRKTMMPISGNIMTHSGFGPILLYGLNTEAPPLLPSALLLALSVISLVGAAYLILITIAFLLELVANLQTNLTNPDKIVGLFCLFVIAAYFAPISSITFYDRYVMPVIGVTCTFLLLNTSASRLASWATSIGTVICLAISTFTVVETHDYLSWNRARWTALTNLETKDHLNAHEIDGGFEYNGARLYNPSYVVTPAKSTWWIDKDTYQIAFGPIKGEQMLAKYAYETWLPPTEMYIYVLKKPVATQEPAQ